MQPRGQIFISDEVKTELIEPLLFVAKKVCLVAK